MPPGRRVEHAVDHPRTRLLGSVDDALGEPGNAVEARRRRRVPDGVHQFVWKHLLDLVEDGAVDGWVEEVVVDADPAFTNIAHRAPLGNIA